MAKKNNAPAKPKLPPEEALYQAVSLCRKAQFDVVFSDIEMPNMNGIELLRSLKRMNSYASVPVIMLSTLDNQEMKDKAASLGAFAYVVKPFNSAKMDEVFSRLK